MTATPTLAPAPIFSNATFSYDGDGKRVKLVMQTNIGSTTSYFVGNYYEVVVTDTGTQVNKYYYAGSQRVAMRKNGTLNFIIGDHLGSTSLVTDASGTVINETKYKAWGETRYSSGNEMTKYQYTGQYSYTNDFGLMYYGARWYDSSLSRFAQADTIVPSGVQGYDRYAAMNNNPIKYIDPSGHLPTNCGPDNIYCGGLPENNYYSQQTSNSSSSSSIAQPATDVTEWLANELIIQWDNNDLLSPAYCGEMMSSLECASFRFGSLYGSHLDFFGNKGIYNIKIPMKERFPNQAVTLCGAQDCRWVDYSTPGNIMFGVLSARRGISQPIAWVFGGLLEIKDSIENKTPYTGTPSALFDNPGDKSAVDWGWQFAQNHPDGFTFEQFQNALTTDALESFQDPPSGIYSSPQSQPNIYPPGYFLNQ